MGKLPHGEALRRINDAHVAAIKRRKGLDEPDADAMVGTTEVARRLGIGTQTFYDRLRDPELRRAIRMEERTGQSGGQSGMCRYWRWGDVKAVRHRLLSTRPGWSRPEPDLPASPKYTGRAEAPPPLAKRVAVVDLPRVALWSIYEVRKGQRVPNRAAELEPGLWATDGARLIPCPWGLDELQRVFVEHEPAPDGARFFTTYKEESRARQLED